MEWNYHDEKLKELQKLYSKASYRVQDKLQEIFDSFKFTNENLFNIADTKTKHKIDRKIEEWLDNKDIKNNYFKMLAESIHRRTRVRNSEILELLIMSVLIEERIHISDEEQKIFKEDMSYYYTEGINEIRRAEKKKEHPPLFCIIPDSIMLAIITSPGALGYSWEQYINAQMVNNSQLLYKQTVINITQGKDLKSDSSEYKLILDNMKKSYINIHDGKTSGALDVELIGANNQAKIEGYKRETGTDDIRVKFIAEIDDRTTKMCSSLNGQVFKVNGINEFYRMYGTSEKDLVNQRFKCHGLVVGLNLPPINYHFHWCRSTITYVK